MKYKELTSTGFLIGLVALLLNDFYLKDYFGNWWTGKLSDFAGLFIFPIFWTAFLPRYKDKIYFLTIIVFVYWKSPYSQYFIDLINKIPFINIARIVDYSDLLAFLVLPFSYFYYAKTEKKHLTIQPIFPIIIASFSFFATTYYANIEYKKNYNFSYSIDTLKYKMYHLKNVYNHLEKDYKLDSTKKYRIYRRDTIPVSENLVNKFTKDTMFLSVNEDFCGGSYNAEIIISGDMSKSKLHLLGFNHNCPKTEKSFFKKGDKEILSKSFEDKIIQQLLKK